MREMLSAFAVLSLFVAVCLLLYPETGTKKYVRFCSSLLLLAATVTLLSGFSFKSAGIDRGDAPTIPDRGEALDQYLIEGTRENIVRGIRNTVMHKFNVDAAKLEVSVSLDTRDRSNIQVTSIEITVWGIENIVKTTRIKAVMEEMFGCVCRVNYSEEEIVIG